MTATVQLTDDELNDLCELTREPSAERAVRVALDEYRRHARRMLLKDASGKILMQDNWKVMEEAETDEPGSR
jgi:hypothetical protein